MAGIQPYLYGCLCTCTRSKLHIEGWSQPRGICGMRTSSPQLWKVPCSWAPALWASYTLPIETLERAFQQLEVCSPPHPRPGVKPSLRGTPGMLTSSVPTKDMIPTASKVADLSSASDPRFGRGLTQPLFSGFTSGKFLNLYHTAPQRTVAKTSLHTAVKSSSFQVNAGRKRVKDGRAGWEEGLMKPGWKKSKDLLW